MTTTVNIIPDLGIYNLLDNIFSGFSEGTQNARENIKGYAASISDAVYNRNLLIMFMICTIFAIYFLLFTKMSLSNTKSNPTAGSMLYNSTTMTKNSNTGMNDSSGLGFIEITLWGLFIFLILMNGLQMFLSLDVKAFIQDLFSQNPKVELEVKSPYFPKPTSPSKQEKEVFHITKNKYNYNEANALCKAYNAELASYDQIKKAHENGAEWCAYGWSKDKLALFPTQKDTYDKLQKIEGHENDCGRPGINGGYIANENVKFGVNCYGYKPGITPMESEVLANAYKLPQSEDQKKEDEMMQQYKKEIPNIILSPFNRTKWSRI